MKEDDDARRGRPDFDLPDQAGRMVRLAALLGAGPVVAYFYPRAGTPGCTREACGFREAQDAFAAAGARVVGIPGDSVEALARFARERKLDFTLLSDAEGGFVPGGECRVTSGCSRGG